MSHQDSTTSGISAYVIIVSLAVVFAIGLSIFGYFAGWFGEAAEVAQEEFGAKAALKKYEWFIDQAARIEKMDADIALFEKRVTAVDSEYAAYGEDKSKWQPHIQIQYNTAKQTARDDRTAVVSQRNGLVAEYNAASDKFNWKLFQTKPDKPKAQ